MHQWPYQAAVLWSIEPLFPSLVDMPRIEQAEREYAIRLGALIQRERLAQDVSQEVLAEAAGVSVTTMGRWERGSHAPRSYQLAKIANRLTTDPRDFFDPPDATSDLDRRMAQKVGEGLRAGLQPRRRATRRSDAVPVAPPAQRRRPDRPGSKQR